MEQQICPKCKGDGLIGVGDMPWMKQGNVSTCDVCSGTGKVGAVGDLPEEQPANEPVQPIAPVINVGDACTTEDGVEGTYQNGENGMVCIANDPAPSEDGEKESSGDEISPNDEQEGDAPTEDGENVVA